MARQINRLNALQVKTLRPGLHADGLGLYLVVEVSGARRWTFIFRFRGKRCEMGLGGTSEISLAAAREAAKEARSLVRHGINPVDARRRQRAAVGQRKFGPFADKLLEDLRPEWKSPIHARQWERALTVEAAQLRDLDLANIGNDDILAVLRPMWTVTPVTASRLRGRIERVLDAAKVKGLRTGDNPASWRGNLSLLLPKPEKLSRGHHPALSYDQMPGFMRDLRSVRGISAVALEFTILTASRTDAARRAHKGEFDLVRAIWTVPPTRLKRKTDHRVPLSARALEIAKDRIKAAGPDGFLFPGQMRHGRSAPTISNMAMANLLPHLGHQDITVHGFRSTFKDWCSDCTTFPNELSEIALHHRVGDATEQAYRRGDGLKMRIQMMESWQRFCDGETNVVALPVGFAGPQKTAV